MRRNRTSLQRRNLSLDSRQLEILGLFLLALGVLTLLSLLNVTSGTASGWWADFLCQLFGWGAYPVALALGAGGVVLLAHNLRLGNIIGWKRVIGLELVFLAGLALAHLLSALLRRFPNPDPLQLAHDGEGGGYVGWAISSILSQALGPLMAFLILFSMAIAGLILTFDLSYS